MEIALRLAGLESVPPDSGILVDGGELQRVLFGIDIETAELLLARQLGFDGVITHHPKGGRPLLDLHQILDRQIDRMVEAGIPINRAQKALAERREEVQQNNEVSNFDRSVSAARLLGMPYIGIHTPADIVGERILQAHLDQGLRTKPRATLGDVIELLAEIPEYRQALAPPRIWAGHEASYAGRVWVAMAGGVSGGTKVAQSYFESGVGTLVVMHMPQDTLKAVRQQGIGNVIIAGHMASDSIGINALIDALEREGLAVTRAAGVVSGPTAHGMNP